MADSSVCFFFLSCPEHCRPPRWESIRDNFNWLRVTVAGPRPCRTAGFLILRLFLSIWSTHWASDQLRGRGATFRYGLCIIAGNAHFYRKRGGPPRNEYLFFSMTCPEASKNGELTLGRVPVSYDDWHTCLWKRGGFMHITPETP